MLFSEPVNEGAHLGVLKRNGNEHARELISRATGRYYTHELVGQHLARALARHFSVKGKPCIRIIDPFCGDGRLVVWLIERFAVRLRNTGTPCFLDVWDCDEKAVRAARRAVRATATNLGIKAYVRARRIDSFQASIRQAGRYDVVVTNPPWEVIKPDRRELRALHKAEAAEYVAALKARDTQLAIMYPLSQPSCKYSGWGTNLARCGTEVALRLTRAGGLCGIVSPASLLADQVSNGLRKWILSEHRVLDVAYYPAEAKLYGQRVDQPSVTLVMRAVLPSSIRPMLTLYDRSRTVVEAGKTELERSFLEDNDYVVPLHLGCRAVELLKRMQGALRFADLEGGEPHKLWAGRELDETGRQSYLGRSGKHPFVKGRMIRQYAIVQAPTEYVREDGPPIPRSAYYLRIAWRDVSRPTQSRRMQATLIPPGWVSGNSLSVAYFRDQDSTRTKALLGILNSIAFEFQLRAHLATAHVSLGTVRKVRIPRLSTRAVRRLAKLVDTCTAEGRSTPRAEVAVARLYGMTRDEFAGASSCFTKLEGSERDKLLMRSLW